MGKKEGSETATNCSQLIKLWMAVVSHWLSKRYTVEFMGIWESVNNPDFNLTEFSYINDMVIKKLEEANVE